MALTEPKLLSVSNDFSPRTLRSGWVDVQWGINCSVVNPCNIYRCKIGNGVRIGPFVEIQSGVVVGDGSVISSHSFVCAGVRIGSKVFIGHHVTFCNDKHPRANNPEWTCSPPEVHDGAAIGSGAVVLPGVIIGEGATVGAGAIVTKSVLPGHTVIGIH